MAHNRIRRALGGRVRSAAESADAVPVFLSPGLRITDPDEAEALGLTADARRLRAATRPDPKES